MIELLPSIILGVVGIGITCYYAYHSQKLADDQMMKELFKDLNARYDKLNDNLIKLEKDKPTLDGLSEEYRQTIIDFFNLCAEEFYWYYHKKRIDPLVWISWNKGMNYWYNSIPAIHELWEQEIKNGGKTSYYITDSNEFFVKN